MSEYNLMPLPRNGEHMRFEDFCEDCEDGLLQEDVGKVYFATSNQLTDLEVNIRDPRKGNDPRFTHVMLFPY